MKTGHCDVNNRICVVLLNPGKGSRIVEGALLLTPGDQFKISFMNLTMIGGMIALQHLGGVRGLFLALCYSGTDASGSYSAVRQRKTSP
jgi:hypothetical protein